MSLENKSYMASTKLLKGYSIRVNKSSNFHLNIRRLKKPLSQRGFVSSLCHKPIEDAVIIITAQHFSPTNNPAPKVSQPKARDSVD